MASDLYPTNVSSTIAYRKCLLVCLLVKVGIEFISSSPPSHSQKSSINPLTCFSSWTILVFPLCLLLGECCKFDIPMCVCRSCTYGGTVFHLGSVLHRLLSLWHSEVLCHLLAYCFEAPVSGLQKCESTHNDKVTDNNHYPAVEWPYRPSQIQSTIIHDALQMQSRMTTCSICNDMAWHNKSLTVHTVMAWWSISSTMHVWLTIDNGTTLNILFSLEYTVVWHCIHYFTLLSCSKLPHT